MAGRNGSFRARLVLAFVLLCVATSALMVLALGPRGEVRVTEALRRLLLATVVSAASGVDGDAFARLDLSDASVVRRPEYARLAALGAAVRGAHPSFREAFALRLEPGRLLSQAVIALAGRHEEVGRVYDASRFPALVAGVDRPAVDDEPCTDEYGTTLSAYAPIRDAEGRAVGVFGVDVDAATVSDLRSEILWMVLGIGGFTTAVGAVLGWFLARRISKPVVALTAAMDRVAAGDFAARVEPRGRDEVARLGERFNAMAHGLADRERLMQAMQVAMEVQQHLLPAGPPSVEGAEVAGFSDYCDETGGDYFDYPRTWQTPRGRVALTMGDVTGHGIGAALLMSTARAALRVALDRDESPSAVLAAVNDRLAQDATAGRFMTLFYGILDPAAGSLRHANAGQGGCCVWRRAGRRLEWLEAGGPPMGVVAGQVIPEAVVGGLVPGDLVVLASDGVYEAADAARRLFGYEGIEAVVRAEAGRTAAQVARALREAVDAHRGEAPQADDVTVVVARLL